MPWPICAVCTALATAAEPSDRTLAASARLIGAARLRLTRDSSSRVRRAITCSASNALLRSGPLLRADSSASGLMHFLLSWFYSLLCLASLRRRRHDLVTGAYCVCDAYEVAPGESTV